MPAWVLNILNLPIRKGPILGNHCNVDKAVLQLKLVNHRYQARLILIN
jgi:hypothetical protein